jgi:hypothetical protein
LPPHSRHPGKSVTLAYTALTLAGAVYALQNAPNPKRTLLPACAVLAVPWGASLVVGGSGFLVPAGA